MNRRHFLALSGTALAVCSEVSGTQQPDAGSGDTQDTLPDRLLLKDYRPRSIYKIPTTEIQRAKYPIIDVHCHGVRGAQGVDGMVKTMDEVNVEKTVIFVGASTPEHFAEAAKPYFQHAGRFELWCQFDLSGIDQPEFEARAVAALEGCHRAGALGVGEISDKGRGLTVNMANEPTGSGAFRRMGPHPDDPRLEPLFDKCAQLGMPVNIHVSDPIWAYLPQNQFNDGLMNAFKWRLDDKPGILGHDGLLQSLENMVRKHPQTVFIACHLANLDYDLTRLGQMFDQHPNLYADISARFQEVAAIPRFVSHFLQKYPDRVLYGTDFAYAPDHIRSTFRIVESLDEHFYQGYMYHWPLHGLGLQDEILKRLYRDNAVRAFTQARKNMA